MMNVNSFSINFLKFSKSVINYQNIRPKVYWRHRKPFWLGLAKSKITKVQEPVIRRNPDENEEFVKLCNWYKTSIKSMKNFIRETDPLLKICTQKDEEFSPYIQNKIELSLKNNEIFNATSSKLRDERLTTELQEYEEKVKNLKEEKKEKDTMRKALFEKAVKLEKIKSMTYITQENLEEAIEKCLSEEVEYNFAIDVEGNKYVGKKPLIEDTYRVNNRNQDLELPPIEDISNKSHLNETSQSPT